MPRLYTKDVAELPKIPDRFGESNWRRFEPVLREFVARYPAPITFKPKHIRPITAVARLRDAVRAFAHPSNNWETDIPVDLFFSYWPQVKLFHHDDSVTIGQQGDERVLGSENDVKVISENFILDAEALPELFEAILMCKNHEVFSNSITVINISEAQLSYAVEKYPNAPIIDNGNEYTII